MNTDTATPKKHYGRNIKRLREILNIKQESLAMELGISQQTVSDLEQKEEIEETMLKKVAQVLKVPVEAIKNFSDEGVMNIVANTFHDDSTIAYTQNYKCTFNPIDKIVQLFEEKEKLYQEKQDLYERMLKAEKEKNGLIEKLIKDKK